MIRNRSELFVADMREAFSSSSESTLSEERSLHFLAYIKQTPAPNCAGLLVDVLQVSYAEYHCLGNLSLSIQFLELEYQKVGDSMGVGTKATWDSGVFAT